MVIVIAAWYRLDALRDQAIAIGGLVSVGGFLVLLFEHRKDKTDD
jgi:hypothetical protein